MNPGRILGLTTLALGGAAAAVSFGARRWNRETRRAVARLDAVAQAPVRDAFATERLLGLPLPVRRYFEAVLTPGQPLARRVRAEQAGEFRMAPDAAWRPFTAVQHYRVRPPAFVWDAAIRMAPGVSVRVRDGYVDGEGAMRAAVAALVPVVNQRGTPGLASGALVRWLAEAVWFPTALLPDEGVRWSAVDHDAARATLGDGATTVSIDFHFGSAGEIVGASTTRFRDVKGTGVPTPWECVYEDYERIGPVRVPRRGEAAWLLPEGRFAYWRGWVTRIEFE